MNEATWMEMGRQISSRMSMAQLTYFLSGTALTAIIVFAGDGDGIALLLTVISIGTALFGILSFDAAQQSNIQMVQSMPESIASTDIGKAASQIGQYQFYRAINAIFCLVIAGVQIAAIN